MNNVLARVGITALVVVIALGAVFLGIRIFEGRDDGQEAIFYEQLSLAEGQERARAEESNLLVLALATWCPHCTTLDRNALADTDVQRVISETTIPVRINISTRNSADFETWPDIDRLRVREVPTLILFGPDGREISRLTGVVDSDDLEAWIRSGGTEQPTNTGKSGRLS